MFALNFREQLASISQFLLNEFDQIVASAQAKWFAQHDATGKHKDVTATSLVSGLANITRLVTGEGKHTDDPELNSLGDYVIPCVTPDTPAFIVSVRPLDNETVYLLSMSTVGRTEGELVLLRHEYEFGLTFAGFTFRSFSTATRPPDSAPFFTPGSGGSTNYDLVSIIASEAALCRLETRSPVEGRSPETYWRVLGVLTP